MEECEREELGALRELCAAVKKERMHRITLNNPHPKDDQAIRAALMRVNDAQLQVKIARYQRDDQATTEES